MITHLPKTFRNCIIRIEIMKFLTEPGGGSVVVSETKGKMLLSKITDV